MNDILLSCLNSLCDTSVRYAIREKKKVARARTPVQPLVRSSRSDDRHLLFTARRPNLLHYAIYNLDYSTLYIYQIFVNNMNKRKNETYIHTNIQTCKHTIQWDSRGTRQAQVRGARGSRARGFDNAPTEGF